MNVTAPFKLQAFELASDPLPRAQLAGAANALKFDGQAIANRTGSAAFGPIRGA
jgi:shikimate dehydrogenase